MIMRICPYCNRKAYSSVTNEPEWRCPYKDCGKLFTDKNREVFENGKANV